MSSPITIQVWTDIQCVWCYIGHARLNAAINQLDVRVEVEYKSFELDPNAPVDFDATEYLLSDRGMSPQQKDDAIGGISRVAAAEGLGYDFERMKSTNSSKAHQLLHYAKSRGRQPETIDRLFRAHFANGEHVGSTDSLADLGAELGFDRADIVRSLDAGEYLAAANADSALGATYGITGVPFYVIDGRYGLSGAQTIAGFMRAITLAGDDRDRAA
jgi:predicted DsbA family dithiol-disulfide isomerase